MKRTEDSLKFDAELGKMLRELRLRVGLTQDALAVAMGRFGRRGGSHVAKLELGRKQQPSLAFVADYLRACRARVSDIADLLDSYIQRPTVLNAGVRKAVRQAARDLTPRVAGRVLKYDFKYEQAVAKPLPDRTDIAKRLLRFQRAAAKAAQYDRIDQVLKRALNDTGMRLETTWMMPLVGQGHKAFALLCRLRKAKPELRDTALAELEELAVTKHVLPRQAVQHMVRVTRREFDKMRSSGFLDWLPAIKVEDLPPEGVKPPSRRKQVRDAVSARMTVSLSWADARAKVVAQVWEEAQAQLTAAGVAPGAIPLYRALVAEVCSAVDHHEPGSDGWNKQLEAAATHERRVQLGQDPALARTIARFVADRFEVLRRTLPNDPKGWVRKTEG